MSEIVPLKLRSMDSRQVLAVLLASLLVFSAGCTGFFGSDGGGSDSPGSVESVPEGVDTVAAFDPGIVDDEKTVTLMNGLIEMGATDGEQQSYEEMLKEAEEESEVSRDDINSITMFAKAETIDTEQYSGFIVDTELSWEDLVEASDVASEDLEDDVTKDSYNGVTVYKNDTAQVEEDAWIADFEDGTFAFGTSAAVKDVIDTREGDADSFSGDLRDAYDSAEDGYMKMAMIVPDEQVENAGQQAGVSTDFVPNPDIVTMSYYTGDETMNVDAEMTMANEEEAEQFFQVVGGALDPPSDQSEGSEQDPFAKLTEATNVDQNGKEVTVAFSMTPEDMLSTLEPLFGAQMGGSSFSVSSNTGVAG